MVDRGPAFDAGMRAGDLIVAVEGEASFGFATAPEATTALRAMLKDKGRATFTVKRPEVSACACAMTLLLLWVDFFFAT